MSDEVAELYTYDEHWRLTAVYVQGPAANGARPEPAAQPRERYVWQPGAFDNNGGDRLVLRERDLDGDPLGVFEERVCFLQNARGDVVAVYSAGDGGDNKRVLLERVRYTEYGEPMCYAAADVNLDGRVDLSDESAWLALLQMGGINPVTQEPDRRMDLNGDGDVSQADFDLWDVAYRQARQKPTGNPLPAAQWANDTAFNGVAEGGVLSVPTRRGAFPPESASAGSTWVMHGVDNRFGFAGSMWDPFLKLYHVRHRVSDPMPPRRAVAAARPDRDGGWVEPVSVLWWGAVGADRPLRVGLVRQRGGPWSGDR